MGDNADNDNVLDVNDVFPFDPAEWVDTDGDGVNLQINAADSDSDVLYYSATGLPDGLSINNSTGVVAGALSLDSSGTYSVSVTVTDNTDSSETNFTWVVHNVNQAPVITLLGSAVINLLQGEVYSDAGATAFDYEDGDLTLQIVASGSVDTAAPGSYTLTYDVTDNSGKSAAQVTRSVNVFGPEIVSFSRLQTLEGQLPDGSYQSITDIHVDSSGNIIVTGDFKGTPDFDPSPGVMTVSDGTITLRPYVYKINSDGTFALWVWTYHGNIKTLTSDELGNIYVTGTKNGGYTNGYPDPKILYVIKLNSKGEQQWVHSYNPKYQSPYNKHAFPEGIVVGSTGSVYVSGYKRGSNGVYAVFVTRLSKDGSEEWTHHVLGSNVYNIGGNATIDSQDNIYLSGISSSGNVSFDTDDADGDGNLHTKYLSGDEAFIVALDASGNFRWVWNTEGSNFSDVKHLQAANGELKIIGTGEGIIDFSGNDAGDNVRGVNNRFN